MEKDKTRLKRPFTRKKQLEQDLAHVNEQMYVKNLELKETLDTLSLLRAIDNLVLESREDLTVLCQNITKAIINYSNYSFIAILVKPPHHEFLELYGLSSATEIKLDTSNFRLHESHYTKWLEELEQTTVIDTHKITSEKLAKLLKKPEPQIESLRQSMHMKSLVLIKLMAQTRLVGLMVVGFNQGSVEISEKNRVSLDRISSAVGIAIDNKLLYEENQRVVRQVKKSNEKLRALDQAKDEFISMASHQLRTPLTSMKGYVSMVMEGDAGKISPPQRKLLDQAFVSSQRMVYLIADLLNVSRLKTGKFVIEPVDSNLADVIEGEISQLKDTAKQRNLVLAYEKPKDFPVLKIDETKIRQVIMNFIDNAIYYTPSGGHINVALKDTDHTVEFTVTDDGIGVPKSEQHHLFTKFYRAGNAEKARPDGTGLGLFMAKKVIVAQGGSLIFKSAEGKGSTFGFSFAKHKLQAGLPKS